MFDNKNVSTLNGLIATTIDSAEGYKDAAEDATSQRYANMFRERAQERREVTNQLRAEVMRLGGNAEDDGTVLASAHRVFMDLRNAVTGKDDEAIIKEVERGEDHIKAKYEDALKDDDLDPACRNVVQECYSSIKQGHDQMSQLKHQITD